VACVRCHHEYQGRRNVWKQGQPVKKCQSCHSLGYQARRPDIKNALHRQCKGCHLKRRQQGQWAGPIECQGCHRQTGNRAPADNALNILAIPDFS
jgi:hypothetical protein